MGIRRLAAGSIGGLLLCAARLLAAGDASAAPSLPVPSVPAAVYPPVSSVVGVSTTDLRVGEVVTVSADGFKPLSAATVTTSLGGVLGSGRAPGTFAAAGQAFAVYPATADGSGVVTASVKFDEPGVHTVTISGVDAAGLVRSVSSEFSISAAAAPAGSPGTPRTVLADEESSSLLEYGAIGVAVIVMVGLGIVSLRVRSARAAAPVRRTPMPPTGPVAQPAPAQPGSAVYPSSHPSTSPLPPVYAAQAPAQAPVYAADPVHAASYPVNQG